MELQARRRRSVWRLLEPLRAELGPTLERFELDVHNAKTIAVAGHPLEVVHHAPVEIARYWHTVRRCPLKLGEEVPHEHDAISVVDRAVVRYHVVAGAAILGDEDLLGTSERLHELRGPVDRLGREREPTVEHPRVRLGKGDLAPAGSLVGGQRVEGRLVDVDADEI